MVAIIVSYFKHTAWFAVVVTILAMAATIAVAYLVTRFPKKRQQDQKGSVSPCIRTVIEEQTRDASQFVYPRLVRFFPSASNEVAIVIEWVNATVFTLVFQTASGSVTMNSMEMGQISPYIGNQRCDPGRRCTCTLYLKPDIQHIKTLGQLQSERKAADWSMNVEWKVLVKDTNTDMTVQGPSGTKRIVPGGDL